MVRALVGSHAVAVVALLIVLGGCSLSASAQGLAPQADVTSFRPSATYSRYFALPSPTQEEPAAPAIPEGERKLRIAIRGGVALARYYGDSVATWLASQSMVSPMGGVSLSILLDDHVKSRFYFMPELLFQIRGVQRQDFIQANKSVRDTSPTGTLRIYSLDSSAQHTYYDRIAYVQMPLLFRVDFGAGNVRPYVSMGPYLGYAISGKHIIKTRIEEEEFVHNDQNRVQLDAYGAELTRVETLETTETSNLDSLSNLDFGSILAVGCSFPITRRVSLIAEGRFDVGFARVFDETRIKNRNKSLCFLIGIEF